MKRTKSHLVLLHFTLYTAFVLYILLMFWLLFAQRVGRDSPYTYWERIQANINLIPFRTIYEFIQNASIATRPYIIMHSFINLIGNVAMFMPLGFFLPCIWVNLRKFWHTTLCAAICIGIIEIVQLFTLLGSCDVDDLILNLLGVAAGYGIYRIVLIIPKRKAR